MGIHNLGKLLKTYAEGAISDVDIKDLDGKAIAMDTSIVLYQFLIAIKNHTDDFKTKDGKVTSHIHAVLMKTLSLLKKKVKPIYVFDGAAPDIKRGTLNSRREIKETAIRKLNEELDDEARVKMQKRSVYITEEQSQECKELLRLMGIPVIEAPEEADPQCVHLVKRGIAYAVGSEDMDILTFGAPKLLRNINNLNKIVEYDLDTILEELGMTQNQFIDMCILLGSDYCPTIEGIGMKRAYDLIKKHKSIEKMIKKDPGFKSGKFVVSDNFNFEEARDYFLNAPVQEVSSEDVKWTKPDLDAIKDILVTKYDYSDAMATKHLGALEKGYYSVICNEKNFMKKCKIVEDDEYDFI